MDSTAPSVGSVVVDELKKQAREEGFVVFTLSRDDLNLYLMYALGVLLGWTIARRT